MLAEERVKRAKLAERLTLRTAVSLMLVGSILICGSILGYYALSTLKQHKTSDTWAILFLELERVGNEVARTLETLAIHGGAPDLEGSADRVTSRGNAEFPILAFRIDGADRFTLVHGSGDSALSQPLDLVSGDGRWQVFTRDGQQYVSRLMDGRTASALLGGAFAAGGRYLVAWRFDLGSVVGRSWRQYGAYAVYLATDKGKLIYTSRVDITEMNLFLRPLVGNYANSPLKQGQFEFRNGKGASFFGFFYVIPNTNLTMFAEISADSVYAPINGVAVKFSLVLVMLLAGGVLLLQVPLYAVTKPLADLVRATGEVGRGVFLLGQVSKGLGEVTLLTNSFTEMAANLQARDSAIAELMKEQRLKVRLEQEQKLISSIQENFLPTGDLSLSSGVEIGTIYVPCDEAAGDYYSFHYDDAMGEFVAILVDVSGHGAGSAMFTAIIAGVFEDCRLRKIGPFDVDLFVGRLNGILANLGRGKWHATLQIIRYVRGSGELEIFNAGHPFPFAMRVDAGNVRVSAIAMPSTMIGLAPEVDLSRAVVAFHKGDTIIGFTDGLTETQSREGKMYGRKRVMKVLEKWQHEGVQTIAERIRVDRETCLGGASPTDDLCVVLVRAI